MARLAIDMSGLSAPRNHLTQWLGPRDIRRAVVRIQRLRACWFTEKKDTGCDRANLNETKTELCGSSSKLAAGLASDSGGARHFVRAVTRCKNLRTCLRRARSDAPY